MTGLHEWDGPPSMSVEKVCPKCGSEMEDVGTRFICPKCGYDSCFGHEEKVKL